MNAVPPSLTPDDAARPAFASAPGTRWAALHDAANVVAVLAGLEPERPAPGFPALIREAAPWRRELAERGIEDLAATMEPGIAALLGINARGADPRAAALALWREFCAARAAILALLTQADTTAARRSA